MLDSVQPTLTPDSSTLSHLSVPIVSRSSNSCGPPDIRLLPPTTPGSSIMDQRRGLPPHLSVLLHSALRNSHGPWGEDSWPTGDSNPLESFPIQPQFTHHFLQEASETPQCKQAPGDPCAPSWLCGFAEWLPGATARSSATQLEGVGKK